MNHTQYVGYDDRCHAFQPLFQPCNIDYLKSEIVRLLQKLYPKKRFVVPTETIVDALSSFIRDFDRPTFDIFTENHIFPDKTFQTLAYINHQVVMHIVQEQDVLIGTEENNKKLSVWDSIPGYDTKFLPHAKLKIKETLNKPLLFNMNY